MEEKGLMQQHNYKVESNIQLKIMAIEKLTTMPFEYNVTEVEMKGWIHIFFKCSWNGSEGWNF